MENGDTICFSVQVADTELRAILLAQLALFDFTGIEETDSGLDYYLPASADEVGEVRTVIAKSGLAFSESLVPFKNWNETWEQSIQPVVVGGKVRIRTSFHLPDPGIPFELIITPKMSFGSGHHPTTALCIQLMLQQNLADKRVLDFGAGTGILSILAEKLGASEVAAVESDGWSMENLMENLELNACNKISAFQQDHPLHQGSFDLVVANLNRNILLAHMPAILECIKPGCTLLLSGILTNDIPEFEQLLASLKFSVIKIEQDSGWAGISAILS